MKIILYNSSAEKNRVDKGGYLSQIVELTGTAGTYGFNSDASVPTGESSTETTSEGNADDNNRELTRSGNIGVTTSQQMLESEIELRKWNFTDMLYQDRRTTTSYNPKAEFFNNFVKFDCRYFNDLNENCVVFFLADSAE